MGDQDEQARPVMTTERPSAATELLEPDPGQLPAEARRVDPSLRERAPRVQVVREPEEETATPGGSAAILAHSPSTAALFAAFAQAQGKYGTVEKTLTAKVSSRRENAAGYSYDYETLADVLEAVRAPNAEHGLAVMQFPVRKGRVLLIRTLLTHSSGEWMSSDLTIDLPQADAQSIGSAITYVRRYALKSILGLAAADEDDDGSRASQRSIPERSEEPPRPARRRSDQPPSDLTPHEGVIIAIDTVDEKSGAVVVEMDTDFKCSTKAPALIEAAKKFRAARTRVTLLTKPSSDPHRFYPILEKIADAAAEK